MDSATNIQEHFAKQVQQYESLMEKLVPYYREQHRILQMLLPLDSDRHYRVLDLGCGNGMSSSLVLEKLPHASLVGFDITEAMLEAYRYNISQITSDYQTIQGDYRTESFGDGYDIIISGMTLHHLTLQERQDFYPILHAALNPDGLYLSNDIIVDEDSHVREDQYHLWKAFMRSGGEDPEFWYDKHLSKDHPLTLSQQMAWLAAAGFQHAGCYWRYHNFAITKALRA